MFDVDLSVHDLYMWLPAVVYVPSWCPLCVLVICVQSLSFKIIQVNVLKRGATKTLS